MTKIIHYRGKCIGCGICAEVQPGLWRMSKKDGKATLVKATARKDVFVLLITDDMQHQTSELAKACPVKIIKVS